MKRFGLKSGIVILLTGIFWGLDHLVTMLFSDSFFGFALMLFLIVLSGVVYELLWGRNY